MFDFNVIYQVFFCMVENKYVSFSQGSAITGNPFLKRIRMFAGLKQCS
jgi:hypothetical protein